MGCGEQQIERTSKETGTHHMFYSIIARGRIGIPATPKTELPMTISNCFLPINITTAAMTAMQNSPTIILLGSGQHPEEVFPGHRSHLTSASDIN